MWFKLGGSATGYTATYELYDGDELLANYTSTFSGGVLRYWHASDAPDHASSFGDEMDFSSIRDMSMDGHIRVCGYNRSTQHIGQVVQPVFQSVTFL